MKKKLSEIKDTTLVALVSTGTEELQWYTRGGAQRNSDASLPRNKSAVGIDVGSRLSGRIGPQ